MREKKREFSPKSVGACNDLVVGIFPSIPVGPPIQIGNTQLKTSFHTINGEWVSQRKVPTDQETKAKGKKYVHLFSAPTALAKDSFNVKSETKDFLLNGEIPKVEQ